MKHIPLSILEQQLSNAKNNTQSGIVYAAACFSFTSVMAYTQMTNPTTLIGVVSVGIGCLVSVGFACRAGALYQKERNLAQQYISECHFTGIEPNL